MPKVVDREQRRRQLAEAVWRIVAYRGLGSVSLRSVASEAGVSMGSVQHYFRDKEQMILFACQHMVDLAGVGANELVDQSDQPDKPESIVRAVMHQTMPLDAQQRAGSAVWLAFVARAAVHEELARLIREAWSETQRMLAQQLRTAQQRSEVSADVDAEREALVLMTMADGMMLHLVLGQTRETEALAAVDLHLDRLFDR